MARCFCSSVPMIPHEFLSNKPHQVKNIGLGKLCSLLTCNYAQAYLRIILAEPLKLHSSALYR